MIGDRPTQDDLERLWRYCDGLNVAFPGSWNGVEVFDGKIHHLSAGSLAAEISAVMNGWRDVSDGRPGSPDGTTTE